MSREAQQRPRVMLVDLNWRHTGYLAAALHEAGFETLLVSTGLPDRIGLGHYCAQVRSPYHPSREYIPFVREQIARFRPDWVIPLGEPLLEMFWNLDPPLSAPTYPPTERWQREILLDRRQLYECAAAAAIPIPRWMPLDEPGDLDQAIRRFGIPLVIRGTGGCSGAQVRIVESEADAQAALEEMSRVSAHPPFAQAFVEGERQIIGGLFSRGEMIRSFAQEVMETHPPRTGPSIRVRSLLDGQLEAHARALFRALRWSGIASADFIRNKAGITVLMEVNPRPWGSIEVAERHGAQICGAFAKMLGGRPVASQMPYRAGVECLVAEAFVQAHRQPGFWPTLRTLESRDLWGCALALPWRRPRLALHLLRRMYRAV